MRLNKSHRFTLKDWDPAICVCVCVCACDLQTGTKEAIKINKRAVHAYKHIKSSQKHFLLLVTRNYGYHGNFFVREPRWQNLSLGPLKDLSLAESFTAKSAMNS